MVVRGCLHLICRSKQVLFLLLAIWIRCHEKDMVATNEHLVKEALLSAGCIGAIYKQDVAAVVNAYREPASSRTIV
eukprot:XP_001705309.1 Hypothetical protein GL50803_6178 [Giardia lamblia ATCC 50803]